MVRAADGGETKNGRRAAAMAHERDGTVADDRTALERQIADGRELMRPIDPAGLQRRMSHVSKTITERTAARARIAAKPSLMRSSGMRFEMSSSSLRRPCR